MAEGPNQSRSATSGVPDQASTANRAGFTSVKLLADQIIYQQDPPCDETICNGTIPRRRSSKGGSATLINHGLATVTVMVLLIASP